MEDMETALENARQEKEALQQQYEEKIAGLQGDLDAALKTAQTYLEQLDALKAGAAPADETQIGIVTSLASLRSAPEVDEKNVLQRLEQGTEVTILGKETDAVGDWYRVSYNGVEGYIAARCIQVK